MVDRRLPEDVDAERSLLSTICCEGSEDMAWEVCGIVTPEDFIVPQHRYLAAAAFELLRESKPINALTLKDRTDKHETLHRVGGFVGITEILMANDVGDPTVLARIVKEKSQLRSLIKIGGKLVSDATNEESDCTTLANSLIEEAAALVMGGEAEDSTPLTEIYHKASTGSAFAGAGKQPSAGHFGIGALDEEVYIPAGEPTLIAARPGVGKTALAVQSAYASAKRGANVLFISLELTKERLEARFASLLTGVTQDKWMRGDYDPSSSHEIAAHNETLERIRVVSPDTGTPWPKLEADIRRHVARHGTTLVYIDYFGLIGRPSMKSGNEAYAYASVMDGLTRTAKNLGIGIVILSQLTKEAGNKGAKKPSLQEIADSDRPARDSALTVMLYKINEHDTWINVPKFRHGKSGFDRSIQFDGERGSFKCDVRFTELQ